MNLLAQNPPENIKMVPLGTLKPPTEAFAPQDYTALGATEPLSRFLSVFVGFATTLAGLMFLIYFIFAGLAWVTAGGDKGKVENAQHQMTNAALGLMIVIASYAIVGIVGGVLGLDILNPGQILRSLAPGIVAP